MHIRLSRNFFIFLLFLLSFFIGSCEYSFRISKFSKEFLKNLIETKTWIYVIIGNRQERINHINSFISQLTGFERVTFVPQVSNRTEAEMYKANGTMTKRYFKRSLRNPQALFCTLSHVKALTLFSQSEYDHALIFEDDVEFSQIISTRDYFVNPYIELNKRKSYNTSHIDDIEEYGVLFKALNKFFHLPQELMGFQFLGYCFTCIQEEYIEKINEQVISFGLESMISSNDSFYTFAAQAVCAHAYFINKTLAHQFVTELPNSLSHWLWDNNMDKWLGGKNVPKVIPIIPIFSQVPRSFFKSSITRTAKPFNLRFFDFDKNCRAVYNRLKPISNNQTSQINSNHFTNPTGQ